MEALLKTGADKSIKDNEGQTSLDDAKYKKLADLIELLDKCHIPRLAPREVGDQYNPF